MAASSLSLSLPPFLPLPLPPSFPPLPPSLPPSARPPPLPPSFSHSITLKLLGSVLKRPPSWLLVIQLVRRCVCACVCVCVFPCAKRDMVAGHPTRAQVTFRVKLSIEDTRESLQTLTHPFNTAGTCHCSQRRLSSLWSALYCLCR